jgi:hypothetical protein
MLATPDFMQRLRHSAFGSYAAYVAHGLRHPVLLRSQATDKERTTSLDGDELVRDPNWIANFTTEIHASVAEVWPWLVQMGYGRAGYYAWNRYDNGGVASADMIVPELQDLRVGDVIPDGPDADLGFGIWRVVTLDAERSLVLHSRRHPWNGRELAGDDWEPFIDCSWAFVLTPLAADRTRLHVRVRAALHAGTTSRVLAKLARMFLGLGDCVMENTMLDGIRVRAEALHAEHTRRADGWPLFD